MCGLIAALLARPTLGDEQVAAALAKLGHRGPDQIGRWLSDDRRMVLGHVRLNVIGSDNGAQPLSNEHDDIHGVVNGELYGYRAARRELRAEGRRFATDSDSEIALHFYEKFGADCVHRLRGEFALVIADQRRRCMFAARDRFGVKPLYYAVRGGDVFFASEIKALFALGVPARWDGDAFFAECHNVRLSHRTLFAGVRALPPGCYLLARDGEVEVHRYWDLDFPTRAALAADRRSDAEVIAGFREVLDDAVAERLVADVEVASYLSGGIDSCAVLGLAQRRASRPLRAFTIALDDETYGEERLAREAAKFVGAELVPVPVTQARLADAFADAIWHAETLALNGHGVAKFLLSKAVRDAGVKVVLTGEGSDEMLAGYAPFRRDMLLHNVEGGTPDEVARRLAELNAANRASRGILVADGVNAPGLKTLEARLGWVPAVLEAFSTLGTKMYPLFKDAYREKNVRANPYADLLDGLDVRGRIAGRDPVNQALYLYAHTTLPTYILTFLGDRVEMAHSVEGRVPFLDHHLAEYTARLPVSFKIRGLTEKYVLREAVKDCVLPEVYARPKHAFMSPPVRHDNDPLAIFCQDVLRSPAVADQPFFDPKQVQILMDRVAAMAPDERAAFEGVVLRVVSTCILQEKFAPAA